MSTRKGITREIVYPDSDGKPLADNTLQLEWIFRIYGGLTGAYASREDVFVASNLLWYPIEGDNKTRYAPDVMVALGRPKGHRGSYMQWREGGVAPQVLFEVLSPGNRRKEMQNKLESYERLGALEYYVLKPENQKLKLYHRVSVDEPFELLQVESGFVSPLCGFRCVWEGINLSIYGPDGRRFMTYVEQAEEQKREAEARRVAESHLDLLKAKLRATGMDPDSLN